MSSRVVETNIKNSKSAAIVLLGRVFLSVTLLFLVFKERVGLPPLMLFYLALLITGAGGGALCATSGSPLGSYSHAYSLDLIGASAKAFPGVSV